MAGVLENYKVRSFRDHGTNKQLPVESHRGEEACTMFTKVFEKS